LFESTDSSGQIAFEGEPRRLSYLTPSDVAGALEKVELSPSDQDDHLMLLRLARLELSRDGQETSTVLVKDLQGLEFSYFGISGDQKEPSWQTEWKHQSKLPTLIRVRLQLGDGSWREQIVAPRLSADVGCAFDPLTKSCRGR
jgi:general secretion pathway protein J